MSTSPRQPPSSPSQIFNQLMENGAIDRFRKSLEKLMFPLSNTRHQSVSKATQTFLQNLPSSSTSLPDPKLLLQQAQHAAIGSVRDAVINDVRRIAVSAEAADLRSSLRRAFDQIVHPRRDSAVGEKRVTQPGGSMLNDQSKTTSAITLSNSANVPDADRAIASHTQLPENVEQRKQSNQSKSPSSPARQQHVPLGTNISKTDSSAQERKQQRLESANMQSIPTDLFQTAHRILQSKEKTQKQRLASEHEREANETPHLTDSQEHSEGQAKNEKVNAKHVVEQEITSMQNKTQQDEERSLNHNSNAGALSEKQESLENHNDSSAEKVQEKIVNHKEPRAERQLQNVNPKPRLSLKATTKKGAQSTDEKQRVSLKNEPGRNSRDLSAASDVHKQAETYSPPAIEPNSGRFSSKEGRKRRKTQIKLAEQTPIATRRRKKSLRGNIDNLEAEHVSDRELKRYAPESAAKMDKKLRKKQGRNNASRKKDVEHDPEKATSKKRARSVAETPASSISPLVDPRNPNRPRGYKVNAPFCVPKDYEEQLKILSVLESLLEKDFAYPFSEPVDPGEEGCSAYLREIANPMDLGTIVKRLKEGTEELGYFKTVQEVLADIELVWWNCSAFNGSLDPVVLDMDRCKLELSIQFENFGVTSMRPRKHRRTPKIRNRYEEYTPEKESTDVNILKNAGSSSDEKQSNELPPPDSDLNDGQLLEKHGMIFRYVETGKVGRKVWSSCKVVSYDASNKSYAISWEDDGTITKNVTFGPGCMFNVHRFRTN